MYYFNIYSNKKYFKKQLQLYFQTPQNQNFVTL